MRRGLILAGLIILVASALAWLFRGNLEDLFSVHDLGGTMTSWASSASTLILGLALISFYIRRALTTRDIRHAYERTGAPRLQRKQRPVRVDVAPPGGLTWIISMLDVIEDAFFLLRGRRVDRQYIRGGGTSDVQLAAHKFYSAQVEGLQLLSEPAQRAIYWEIVVLQMEQLGEETHPDAISFARKKRDQDANPYIRSLFDVALLRKADLTYKADDAHTYFSKFFQPLLRAFHERRFLEPESVDHEEANAALMAHVGLLKAGKVAAARFDAKNRREVSRDQVDARVCQELPTSQGKGAERETIREHNHKAARSVLVVCDTSSLDLAGAFDHTYRIKNRFAAAEISIRVWRPDPTLGNTHAHLWQQWIEPKSTAIRILA